MQRKGRIFYTAGTLVLVLATSMAISSFAITLDPTIPSAADIVVTTTSDTPAIIALSGASNDMDAGGALTVATTTSPSHGTLGLITGQSLTYTPDNGYTGTDTFSYIATEGATSSPSALVSITVTAPLPATGVAHITIRNGTTIATSSAISFALSGTTDVTATTGGLHTIAASSTLASLVALDALSSDFSLSTLEYNGGFGAFYLKCILIPTASSDPACDNWQYTVNGTTPSVGMDSFILHDGDVVYVYFGYPRQVVLSSATIASGESVTATAQQYDPSTGNYVGASHYTIGLTQTNPADPWNPLEIATSTSDTLGQAVFSVSATGTYAVGIQEDYYFPTATLTVTDAPIQTSFGGSVIPRSIFDVPLALQFLLAQQNTDGSFSSPIITDWAALAFAAGNPSLGDSLKTYLRVHPESFSSVTDNERRAMALQSVGIDPYTGTGHDYIAPIVGAFDGTQIGDSALDNDDIFALLVLTHAGYTQSDDLIQKIASFVISRQKPDGSWDSSVDMTAAAIQALGPLYAVSGSGRSLGMASGYLAAKQQSDGGWGALDSTSWALTAITSIREGDPAHAGHWTTSSGNTPEKALAAAQQNDGGVASGGDRVWSTAYAITAGSGKSWLSILQSFQKPTSPTFGGTTIEAPTASTSSTSTVTIIPQEVGTTTATSTSVTDIASTTPAQAGTSPHVAPVVKKIVAKPIVKKISAPLTSTTSVNRVVTRIPQTAAVAVSIPESFLTRVRVWFSRLFQWRSESI